MLVAGQTNATHKCGERGLKVDEQLTQTGVAGGRAPVYKALTKSMSLWYQPDQINHLIQR